MCHISWTLNTARYSYCGHTDPSAYCNWAPYYLTKHESSRLHYKADWELFEVTSGIWVSLKVDTTIYINMLIYSITDRI